MKRTSTSDLYTAMITFRDDFGCWWPDYDHKPDINYARISKYVADVRTTVGLCKQRDQVVQAGGHAGIWPLELAKTFKTVHTFEPEPALFECLKRNTDGTGIKVWDKALGEFVGEVKLRPHCSAGSWRVSDEQGKVPVKQITVDSLGLTKCNALILDIEGYEPQALRGAAQTIARCRPVIHVEMLPRAREAIAAVLSEFGYKLYKKIHSDEIHVPR